MHQAAQTVEVLLHVDGIDQELVDDPGEAHQREVEGDRRVRADHALDRGMRDVAFVPERDILHRRHGHAAHEAREAGEIFRQHRVALVRHGRRTLLALGEELFRLQNFGALHVADFDRQALDARRDDAERGEEHGVAVARDDLRRDRFGLQAEALGDVFFDARVDIGEGANGAGDGAGRDFFARRDQALLAA